MEQEAATPCISDPKPFIFPPIPPTKSQNKRAGPSVILGHSQGASLAFQVMQRRPELVKGLVAVEPYAVGDADMMDRVAHIPVLFVLGDNMEKHPI